MATNYPGAIDSLTNPSAGDALDSPSHAGQHANANDAIEAVQAELGTDPAGGAATVKARFEVIEANDWVTSARIAADAVGSSEIAANAVGSSELADNAVDTAAIADGAVTAAKLADGTIVAADVAADTFAAFGTVGNLLTTALAGVSTTGLFTLNNCTEGAAGVFTASAAGVFEASLPTMPVAAGDTVTATVTLATVGRSGRAIIQFQTAAGVSLGDNLANSISAGATGESRLTVTAPPTATKCKLYVVYTGSGAGTDTVTVTKIGLWKGAGGVWQLPGVPVPGLSRIAVNNAVDLSGTGSPEGVVTAAPGSTWLQTDSTTDVKGWLKWVKATGTGNTGWVAGPEADTGLRNIAGLVANSWSVATVMVARRIGNLVTIDIQGLSGASASTDTFLTAASLAMGKPSLSGTFSAVGHLTNAYNGTAPRGVYYSTGTNGFAADRTLVTAGWGRLTYITADSWPSSNPGSAA